MARFNSYTPPKDEEELEKRKILAEELWRFTRDDVSPEYAKTLVEEGAKIGVDRKQLSNLYKQYKEVKDLAGENTPNTSFKEAESMRKGQRELEGVIGRHAERLAEKARSEEWYNKPWNMGSASGRLITSPEGQLKSMLRKAERSIGRGAAGALLSGAGGDLTELVKNLRAAGFTAGGITTQEEALNRDIIEEQRQMDYRNYMKEKYEREQEERRKKEEEEQANMGKIKDFRA